MKEINLLSVVIAMLVVLLTGCNDKKEASEGEDNLKVYSSGDKIYYSGEISQSGYEEFKALLSDNIVTLVINSSGGDIVPGMAMGELVFEKKLNVQVQDYCLSSCANYIFPAGKTKYLAKGSQLGWHGGATQSFSDEIVPEKTEDRQRFIELLTGLIQQENAFFKKIKVNQLVTTYGQAAEKHLEVLKAHKMNCAGWSYTVDGLAAFGINNVVLKDGQWEPSSTYKDSCIHHFDMVTIR
ncbi:hypothetical protein OK023_12985 [Serratia sp. UGAL515B_01]|nr:hypothetical protein OK023_12985 [Serratia sp. UGAL515B_01]